MSTRTVSQSSTGDSGGVAVAKGAILQRACACGGAAGVSGKCSACGERESLGVQPTLRVSRPTDRYEREADGIADRMMSSPAALSAGPLSISPLVQRQPVSEEENDETLQAKAAGTGATPASAGFARKLSTERGGGRPLAASARRFFEPRFGRDLSAVRIHDGAAASSLSREISSRAFTHGQSIFFATGEYDPDSTRGRRLLAHELTHTIQQRGTADQGQLQRLCTPSATCSTPIPGNPEDFSTAEGARETRARRRRQRMSRARARSSGHGGRARQLETILQAHDPARRNLVHGIFIDADLSSNTSAMVQDCGDWRNDSLPAGDPDPDGLAAATKDCMFVPGRLNREALQFHRGATTIGGVTRDAWQADTLDLLIHETEHVRFHVGIEPGLAVPAGASGTCTRSNVAFNLSEIVSILSPFPVFFDAAEAEANPVGPAHQRLSSFLDGSVSNTGESFNGALLALGCKCDCALVDAFVIQAVDAVTTGWTAAQKTAFRTMVRSRMPAPARPFWPMAPTP